MYPNSVLIATPYFQKGRLEAEEIGQQLNVLLALPEDLNSVPSTFVELLERTRLYSECTAERPLSRSAGSVYAQVHREQPVLQNCENTGFLK